MLEIKTQIASVTARVGGGNPGKFISQHAHCPARQIVVTPTSALVSLVSMDEQGTTLSKSHSQTKPEQISTSLNCSFCSQCIRPKMPPLSFRLILPLPQLLLTCTAGLHRNSTANSNDYIKKLLRRKSLDPTENIIICKFSFETKQMFPLLTYSQESGGRFIGIYGARWLLH